MSARGLRSDIQTAILFAALACANAALLAFPQKTYAAPQFVQVVQEDSGGFQQTSFTTSGVTTKTGNAFIVGVTWSNEFPCPCTVTITDSKGNTYSPAMSKQNSSGSSLRMQIFYVTNAVGGSSHTFTATFSA